MLQDLLNKQHRTPVCFKIWVKRTKTQKISNPVKYKVHKFGLALMATNIRKERKFLFIQEFTLFLVNLVC